ncbi:MAG: Inosine-5'-monophosphate dehydrogenase [Ignavibacteria bacterium]|nr:Inosine-5'-monophosphate dehydrogenase [Ignavibacteria bacterium]
MKVREILKSKGPAVFTIGRENSVQDALKILVVNNIGVLIVIDSDGKICGILSERDIIRDCYNSPDNFRDKKIDDIMTKKVIIIEADDDIKYAEGIMSQNHIRHLPVVSEKNLVGLISIGDVVNALLSDTQVDNKYMFDYISGNIF